MMLWKGLRTDVVARLLMALVRRRAAAQAAKPPVKPPEHPGAAV